jgi:spore coat protein CotF
MALKTFNIDDGIYKSYSKSCKQKGISMSKQVENFLRSEMEKIVKVDSKEDIDVKKISRDMKNFDKSLEHPLKKYC